VVRQLHYTPFLPLLKTQLVWRQYKFCSLWQFLACFFCAKHFIAWALPIEFACGWEQMKWKSNQAVLRLQHTIWVYTEFLGMFRAAKTEARGAPRLRFARVGQTKDIFFSVFPIFLLIYCWVTAVVAKATLSLLLPLQHTCHICQGKNNSCDGLRTTEYLRCDPKTRAGNAVAEQALPIISHNLIKRQIKPNKFVS